MDGLAGTACGVLLALVMGVVSGVAASLVVLRCGRPRLRVAPFCPEIVGAADASREKHVGVSVWNEATPRGIGWFYDGEAATGCRIWFRFRDEHNRPVSDPSEFPEGWIPGRWDQAPHPQFSWREAGDLTIMWVPYEIDIAPKTTARQVQVAVRTERDRSYVWNDETMVRLGRQMSCQPELERLELKLPKYIVTVRITAHGREYCSHFYLYANKDRFQLEEASRS